jgi:molybdopterin converting factor small subunit
MAHVTVSYRAKLEELAGTHSEEFDADDIADLLREINNAHGAEAYKLAKAMIITVNGISIIKKQVYRTRLTDGDKVNFFSLAAGG